MAKLNPAKISDVDVAKAVIAHEAVDCFCGAEETESAQSRHLVSCTGGTFHGCEGENWPRAADGEPLIPWLQIVCTEMKNLYGAFYNRKSVCFYIRQDIDSYEATSASDDSDFVVREYSLTDELVPLARPSELEGHPFRLVRWKKQPDYPALGKYYGLFDDDVYDTLCKMERFKYENRSGIKIGGWPTPVQQDQEYPGSCDLQIDMTENFMYGDSGVGYLTRTGDKWYVLFECC